MKIFSELIKNFRECWDNAGYKMFIESLNKDILKLQEQKIYNFERLFTEFFCNPIQNPKIKNYAKEILFGNTPELLSTDYISLRDFEKKHNFLECYYDTVVLNAKNISYVDILKDAQICHDNFYRYDGEKYKYCEYLKFIMYIRYLYELNEEQRKLKHYCDIKKTLKRFVTNRAKQNKEN